MPLDLEIKLEPANKFTFVWRKSVERYNSNLIEKSNVMYDELLKKEIIPAIERENKEELSVEELELIVERIDNTIDTDTKKIDESDVVSERKQLRSERKESRKYRKLYGDILVRKQKYQRDRVSVERSNVPITASSTNILKDFRTGRFSNFLFNVPTCNPLPIRFQYNPFLLLFVVLL